MSLEFSLCLSLSIIYLASFSSGEPAILNFVLIPLIFIVVCSINVSLNNMGYGLYFGNLKKITDIKLCSCTSFSPHSTLYFLDLFILMYETLVPYLKLLYHCLIICPFSCHWVISFSFFVIRNNTAMNIVL